MVRSMYSGVAGMRAQQTAMDTIGNNIANVNTNGFKGSRTTFSDVLYQNLRGASAASASRGGVNASQVGVGAQVRSVDLMMTRSSFTQTDMGMDVAIDGEGFLQVMDADGNKFYTRAGQLLFDASGNLVDSKGNFVLGTNGDPFGKEPSSDKIQVALGSVNPAAAKKTETIDGVKWTVSTSNNTDDGNVGIQFVSDSTMAVGEDCKAEVTDSGIVVKINGNTNFANVGALSTAVDKAIQAASNAKTQKNHPAGTFTITQEGMTWPAGGLTGAQICSSDKALKEGSISNLGNLQGYGIKGFGKDFLSGLTDAQVTAITDGSMPAPTYAVGPPATWTISMVIGGVTYTSTAVPATTTSGTAVRLKNGTSDTDYIDITVPDISKWSDTAPPPAGMVTPPTIANMQKSAAEPLKVVRPTVPVAKGLGSKSFVLEGGTAGGPQGIESLSGVSIGVDGVISGQHSLLGDIKLGRIDLATFVNPSGLSASGGTYFATSPNSGTMKLTKAGQNGSGQIVAGALELSNVDLSREFTDMIKTQRGYQANSRIITVSDTMLEELVNLKR